MLNQHYDIATTLARMIRAMQKLQSKHELSGVHDVDFTTSIKDGETWATLTIKRITSNEV